MIKNKLLLLILILFIIILFYCKYKIFYENYENKFENNLSLLAIFKNES